jgi:energy-coupling factor transporter ATP-binding protein EcfA2
VGEKGLILYGPNGTGKTSVIDAIEFLLTRRSTLFAENRMGVNWDSARQHVRSTESRARLTLKNGANEFDISCDSAFPAEVARWCELAAKSSFLLRRYMLLRFIDAQPRNRYDQLAPFLNLKDFVQFETALAALVTSIDAARSSMRFQFAANTQTMRTSFGLAPTDSVTMPSVLKKINEKLSAANLENCEDETSCEQMAETVKLLIASDKPSDRDLCLTRMEHAAQQIASSRLLAEMAAQLASSLQELEIELATHERLFFTELLQDAKKTIDLHRLTECPVCERPIDLTTLSARLQERIDADVRVTTLRGDLEKRKLALIRSVEQPKEKLSDLVDEWGREIQIPVPASHLEELSLLVAIKQFLESGDQTAQKATDLKDRLLGCQETRHDLISVIDELMASEEQGQVRVVLSEVLAMLKKVAADWKTFAEQGSNLSRLDMQWRALNKAHEHAIEARKEIVQKVLGEINSIANKFYGHIHPGEGIANANLIVRPTEDSSLNLQNEFYGKTASPMLYLSESHLDTLGLCYFLALRKTESTKEPGFKLLVLDDVLHSVDADHRVRVAQLLKQEFSDHQLVVTTHDDVFFGRMRSALGSGGFEYQRFHGWDICLGPLIGDSVGDIELISDASLRMSVGVDTLAAACGRAFEWMLRELNERLEVAIPARFHRSHDIGSMWPPLSKKLKKMKGFANIYPTLCEDIELNSWVRNFAGAHFNEGSAGVTPRNVQDFAALLDTLYNATHCGTCNEFIKRDGDDTWRCEQGCLHYSSRPRPFVVPIAASGDS